MVESSLAFQYDPESLTGSSEVTRGLLDILDLMVPGAEDLMGEMNTFHERREGFGRKIALNNVKCTRPVKLLS